MDEQKSRYLMVEAGEQVFAVALTSVVEVHLLSADQHAAVAGLAALDLTHLTGGRSQPGYAVVLSDGERLAAITVTSLRPVGAVAGSDVLVLPALLKTLDLPFAGLVRQFGTLTLILDVARLIDLLQKLAPQLVMERPHVS